MCARAYSVRALHILDYLKQRSLVFRLLCCCCNIAVRALAVCVTHYSIAVFVSPLSCCCRRLCGHSVNDMSSVRLAWHPTSAYLASTSDKDNSVYVWDVATQAIVDKVCKHTSRVRSVVCWHDVRSGPSAYFVSASFDKSVMVWTAPWVPLPTMHDE